MELIVDGAADFACDSDAGTILSVLECVNARLREGGRAILRLRVDGRDVSASDLAKELKDKPVTEVARLEVESAQVRQLVNECLDMLARELPHLPQACHELAAEFQGPDPANGYEPCHKLAEIWGHVKSRQMLVISALELDMDSLDVNGKGLGELHRDLNDQFEQMIAALEAQDCVRLGDLVEYELAPRAETEAKIVAVLQEKARERFG